MKVSIRNDAPTSRVRNDVPIFRLAQTGIRTIWSEIQVGTPIGLLLALTYAQTITIPTVFKGESPIARIRNTD